MVGQPTYGLIEIVGALHGSQNTHLQELSSSVELMGTIGSHPAFFMGRYLGQLGLLSSNTTN